MPTLNGVLLLTSCIEPKYRHGIARVDPTVRLDDYAVSLCKWIKDGRWNKIVFADNSGWSESRICTELTLRVGADVLALCDLEILCVEDLPRHDLHYGYSELGIIDHAVLSSRHLHDADYFVKVTGRLYFPDAATVIPVLAPGFNFWVDARRRIWWWNSDHITTQLMFVSLRFYREHLLNLREKMTADQPYIENFLYDFLLRWRGAAGCNFRWHRNLDPVGVAAHNGATYSSRKRMFAAHVRAVLRVLVPNFWF